MRSPRVRTFWWHSSNRDSRPSEFQPYVLNLINADMYYVYCCLYIDIFVLLLSGGKMTRLRFKCLTEYNLQTSSVWAQLEQISLCVGIHINFLLPYISYPPQWHLRQSLDKYSFQVKFDEVNFSEKGKMLMYKIWNITYVFGHSKYMRSEVMYMLKLLDMYALNFAFRKVELIWYIMHIWTNRHSSII